MSIIRYDKVILIKEFGNLKMVGNLFEVANITETSVILRNANDKIAVGAISIDVFDQYFKKPEEVKSWTPWQRLVDEATNTLAFYRTNLKKVQVRTISGTRAEATCSKYDDFNLHFGIQLAYARCMDKFYNEVIVGYEEGLKNAKSDMIANQNVMKRMINSLDKEVD